MTKVGSFRVLVVAVVLVCGPFFLGPEGLAQTAGIAVTTTADELDPDGECSLREAILNANNDDQSGSTDCPAGSGKDTIDVPAGTYTLTITGTGEDSSATGDLDITGDSIINGAGEGSTIVQAGTTGTEGTPNGIDRVFDVERPTAEATLSGVAVRNGNLSEPDGGGLRAYGSNLKLEIKNSLFTGNTASRFDDFGGGGGAHIRARDVIITNTTFPATAGSSPAGSTPGACRARAP